MCVQDVKRDLEISQSQKEEAVMARQEIEVILRNTKKEMEVQELVRLTVQPSTSVNTTLSTQGALTKIRSVSTTFKPNIWLLLKCLAKSINYQSNA